MRRALIALFLAAAPLAACATHPPHVAVSRAQERVALAAAEKAYAEAHAAYLASNSLGPEERLKAYNALTAAHSALEATHNAFQVEGAPTFMDQAVAAKKLADDAKAKAAS